MKLEDIADVSRFQDKREQAGEDDEWYRNGLVYGEARTENNDPVTGFLIPSRMAKVGLFRQPKKYALRKNDILMFYSGAAAKIASQGWLLTRLRPCQRGRCASSGPTRSRRLVCSCL